MNDKSHKPVSVTLPQIDWTHVCVVLSWLSHEGGESRLVRERYADIARRIRDQVGEEDSP